MQSSQLHTLEKINDYVHARCIKGHFEMTVVRNSSSCLTIYHCFKVYYHSHSH